MLIALTRPAASLASFLFLFSTAFAPIAVDFIFFDLFYIGYSPEAHPKSTERFGWWGRNLLISNPTVQRISADADKFCDFNSRIFLHLSNTTGCQICQEKKRFKYNAGRDCRNRTRRRVSQMGCNSKSKRYAVSCTARCSVVPAFLQIILNAKYIGEVPAAYSEQFL
jgi:hypothetical protein